MHIGILGGGQLARMLILAGRPLGLDFVVYVPEVTPTIEHMADVCIGQLDDFEALTTFLNKVDVVTFENENIPASTLDFIQTHTPMFPGATTILCAQDRLHEKQTFNRLDIPTNAFYAVDTTADLPAAAKALGFPFLLKSRRFGYDGKFQYKVETQAQLDDLIQKNEIETYLAEAFVPFDREISQVAVRAKNGEIAFYDVSENVHLKGVLLTSQNKPHDPLTNLAQDFVKRLLDDQAYVGTLALEFFVLGDQLVANEIAPRVHNSGHWTMDAAITSQFENHIRAVAGLPLGATTALTLCTMYNILGAWPERNSLLSHRDLKIHDYCKAARPGRKLGHLNLIGPQDTAPNPTDLLNTRLS